MLGDSNMTSKDKNVQRVTDTFILELLINELTCFKASPSCIDLIITNRNNTLITLV